MNGSIKELFKMKRKFLNFSEEFLSQRLALESKNCYFCKSSTILIIYGSHIILRALFYALYS